MIEHQLELETLAWLQGLGYTDLGSYDLAADGPTPA